MAFAQDLIFGQRPDIGIPGYASDFYNKLKGYLGSIDLGKSGHEYKHIIKDYNSDPASLATMSLARGAVNTREQTERQGQGANALIGAAGGEQANLMHAQQENARAKLDEQTGLNAIGESNQKYFGALGGLQDSINSRRQAEMGTLGMMGNILTSSAYDRNRKGGIINPQTWSNALAAFAGGAGAGM
jgi:hypothetical protein